MVDVYSKTDTNALLAKKAGQPATSGTNGQVLTKDSSAPNGTSWVTPTSGGGNVSVPDATTTSKGVVQLAGDLTGSASAPSLKQINSASKTYGSSTVIPQITVDTAGRVTAVNEVAAAAASGGGGSSTGGVTATVDGASVSRLDVSTSVTASDVGALPLPSGTPAAGQVPVVTSVTPLGLGWGSTGSGGSASPVGTTVNLVSQFGGKGDGILTTDLSVTAGSKNISSAIAPFKDTATDKGKLVIWLTGATTEVGVIDTVQSTTQATLVTAAVANSVAFGGPNGNGAIGSDNTTAINNALAAAQAVPNAAGSARRTKVAVPCIDVPGGIYLTRGGHIITQPNGMISGDGREQTLIVAAVTSGNLFQMGTFNASPQDAFQGTAFNWTWRDLHILDATRISTGTEGQRTVNGIVDYGNGGMHIENCRFTGLKYGVAGAHGSDFSDIRWSFFTNCDTGYYFGPGSQQLEITKTDVADSREGAVFEGAPHWAIHGGSFEDLTGAAVTLEAQSSGTAKTRFGVNANIGGAFYNGNFIIDGGVWFETNAGGNGRLSPRIILVKGDGPFGPVFEGLTIRDAYVISGGSQQSGGTNTFLEFNVDKVSDQPVIIDGLYISDPSFLNSVFRAVGTAADAKPKIMNVRKPSNVALTQGAVNGVKYINRDGTMHGFTTV